MRYTSEATMDDQGLRDVDRWKDKIEVRLDNRQVAFLFFGSALVACMLFILGVIVGKRLESRGRALAPEIEDPLALLDRVAATTPPPAEAVPAETPSPVKPAKVVKREPAAAVVPDLVEDEPASVVETPKPAEKVAEKPVAKAPEKTADKTAEKAPEKTVAKPTAPAEVKSADIMPPS